MQVLPSKDSGTEVGVSLNASVGALRAWPERPGEIMETSRLGDVRPRAEARQWDGPS